MWELVVKTNKLLDFLGNQFKKARFKNLHFNLM